VKDLENLYKYAETVKRLYDSLQDDRSKEVFWARLQCDIEPSEANAQRLEDLSELYLDEIERFLREAGQDKKLLLYGAGDHGKMTGRRLVQSGYDFYGYCDRNAAANRNYPTPRGCFNKPIFSPEELLTHKENWYAAITTDAFVGEISDFLNQSGFPASHVLPYAKMRQYFDFPELFPKGTAFVDVGCFDGSDSIRFAQWCGGAYSKILAFEPDPQNYQISMRRFSEAGLENAELIAAGLNAQSKKQILNMRGGSDSFLAEESGTTPFIAKGRDAASDTSAVEVQTYALDDLTQDLKIGFVKMDIEGMEYNALQGAQATIQRDKPLLTICVYHRRGDVLAIMNYLHSIVPEYRFWLRHYGPLKNETVLYVSV